MQEEVIEGPLCLSPLITVRRRGYDYELGMELMFAIKRRNWCKRSLFYVVASYLSVVVLLVIVFYVMQNVELPIRNLAVSNYKVALSFRYWKCCLFILLFCNMVSNFCEHGKRGCFYMGMLVLVINTARFDWFWCQRIGLQKRLCYLCLLIDMVVLKRIILVLRCVCMVVDYLVYL